MAVIPDGWRATVTKPWNILLAVISAVPSAVFLAAVVSIGYVIIAAATCDTCTPTIEVLTTLAVVTGVSLLLGVLTTVPIFVYNRRDPAAAGVVMAASSAIGMLLAVPLVAVVLVSGVLLAS